MYGDPNGQPMTEATPNRAHTKKGKLRAQMVDALMAAHNAGRVQVAVGRASDFIGPRVSASAMGGDLVIKAAIKGKAAQVATAHHWPLQPRCRRASGDGLRIRKALYH